MSSKEGRYGLLPGFESISQPAPRYHGHFPRVIIRIPISFDELLAWSTTILRPSQPFKQLPNDWRSSKNPKCKFCWLCEFTIDDRLMFGTDQNATAGEPN